MMGGAEAIVGVVAFSAVGAIGLTLAKAVGQRIAGGGPQRHELDALREETEQLRAELDAVQARLGQVDEIQSRLDFAERVLAQGRAKDALPGGRS